MRLEHEKAMWEKDQYHMRNNREQPPHAQPDEPHQFFKSIPNDERSSLSDPAVNVLMELMDIVALPPALCNHKFDIQTISDLFDKTVAKSESLKAIVDQRAPGSSLLFVMTKFVNIFGAKRGLDMSTKNLLKLLATYELCPTTHPRLQLGLKTACVLTHAERLDLMSVVRKTGSLPAIENIYYSSTILELPGIQELMELNVEVSEREAIKSLCDFVMAYACFQSNIKGKLIAATLAWKGFSAHAFEDCENVISTEESLYGVCLSWGLPCTDEFERAQRLIKSSPQAIQAAYVDYVSDDKNKINELDLTFAAFLVVYRKVWDLALRITTLKNEFGLDIAAPIQRAAPALKYPAVAAPAASPLPVSQPAQGDDLHDITIPCKGCFKGFMHTVSQQQLHIRKGYESSPVWCPDCKPKKSCHQFASTGSCDFGDNCSFTHGNQETIKGHRLQPLTPGQYSQVCKYAAHCERGDECPFQHPGRESQQRAKAAAAISSRDQVPTTGFAGLSRKP
jgi:hypothetical protein